MNKVIHVNFKKSEVEHVEEIEKKEPKLDPVLAIVKKQLKPEDFEVYKKTIDDWMERCFLYEIEQKNKKK